MHFRRLYPPQGNNGLGTASMVLGITCLLFAWVPVCGIIAWPLCLVGLILAIVDLCQRNRPHAHSIAGLILSITGFVAPFVCLFGTAMIEVGHSCADREQLARRNSEQQYGHSDRSGSNACRSPGCGRMLRWEVHDLVLGR